MNDNTGSDTKSRVREHYARFVEHAVSDEPGNQEIVRREKGDFNLYTSNEVAGLPEAAVATSAGCGNPAAHAALQCGETVVDFGCGGGVDCFLASRAVGPGGRVVGVDMTEPMIELAERNARKLGLGNVEFHLAEIESTPLPDAMADVVMSNCVICLVADVEAVFREAYRLLSCGGRLYVSDIVAIGPPPADGSARPEYSYSCAGRQLCPKTEYLGVIERVGFRDVRVLSAAPYEEDGIEQEMQSISVTARKA